MVAISDKLVIAIAKPFVIRPRDGAAGVGESVARIGGHGDGGRIPEVGGVVATDASHGRGVGEARA